jgi:uncharacterized protein
MYMDKDEMVRLTEEFVKKSLTDRDSGHDWWHILRVRRLARFINEQEDLSDPFILDIAALLHDSADHKFSGEDTEKRYDEIRKFMNVQGLSGIRERVIGVIKGVSFSRNESAGDTSDPVLLIIRDADRLDAIGAIGIARAFNYGGFRNNPIFNPDTAPGTGSTLSHFYEKLLTLKYRMNTMTAKKLAAERHEFMELFLRQFYREWEFGLPGMIRR